MAEENKGFMAGDSRQTKSIPQSFWTSTIQEGTTQNYGNYNSSALQLNQGELQRSLTSLKPEQIYRTTTEES